MLQVERATLSAVVASLVREGLVEQVADRRDQRQKLLRLTTAGSKLWGELPDLSFIRHVAFQGIDARDIDTTIRVVRVATERLENFLLEGDDT